jgi:hypothetical protein
VRHNYAGDQGDLTKYALLRALQGAGFSVGVNWYLSVHDEANGDGHVRHHLEHPEQWEALDPPLVHQMHRVFGGLPHSRRSVALLEDDALLPGATFFTEPLPTGAVPVVGREAARQAWHQRALAAMAGVDLVCLDPDNGLEVASQGPRSKWRCKYATYGEIGDYLARGQAVVCYQHARRVRWAQLVPQLAGDMRAAGASMADPGFIAFGTRGFLLLSQEPEVVAKMTATAQALCDRLSADGWRRLRTTVIAPAGPMPGAAGGGARSQAASGGP